MNEKLKDQDVLLVTPKGDNKPLAVTGLNEDGTPKTTDPKEKNQPDFLKIDKNSDVLENFMSNFMQQCKDPTHFQFFKVPITGLDNIVVKYINELSKMTFECSFKNSHVFPPPNSINYILQHSSIIMA